VVATTSQYVFYPIAAAQHRVKTSGNLGETKFGGGESEM